MRSIIDNLFACQIPNTTAQGKPTLITLTLEELAKVLIMNIGPSRFSYLPEVVKNLLIINALFSW